MAVRIIKPSGAARIVEPGGVQRITEALPVGNDNRFIVTFTGGDQRTDIQSAIDTVATAGGGTVLLEAGRVYEVSQTGNAAQLRRVTPIRYCVVLKQGVILDGNGSTIRIQNNQNAFAVINEGVTTNSGTGPTQRDADMGVINLKIDGNRANQSGSNDQGASPPFEEQGCIAMQSCDRLTVRNLEVNSSQCYGARFLDCFDSQFAELRSFDVRGDAYAFGLQEESGVPLEMFESTIGNGVVMRAEGGYSFPGTGRSAIQGNPWIGCFVDSTVGDWTARNCGGGYKLENRSLRSKFGQHIFSGEVLGTEGDFNTDNSGFKIQGFGGGRPSQCNVAGVTSYLAQREGLRFTDCDDCHVGNVHLISCNTGTPGSNQDVFVTGLRCSIGSYRVENSNANASILVNIANCVFSVGQAHSFNHIAGDLIAWNQAGNTIHFGPTYVDKAGRVFNNNSTNERAYCSSLSISGNSTEDDTKESNANIVYGNFFNNRPAS